LPFQVTFKTSEKSASCHFNFQILTFYISIPYITLSSPAQSS
jgi:hypothetical protein